jgi:hypothetical protein
VRLEVKTWDFDDYSVNVPDSHYDLYDDNIEVYVILKSGERYKTTLFTDKYEEKLKSRLHLGDKSSFDLYFAIRITVRDLMDETILNMVANGIANKSLKRTFDRYE